MHGHDEIFASISGNQRDYCAHVCVIGPGDPLQDTIFDLDRDDDGNTDPNPDGLGPPGPFDTDLTNGVFQNTGALLIDDVDRLLKLYITSFWKVHLSKDPRFKHYLIPGWSKGQEPDADVSLCKLTGKSGKEVCIIND